MSAGTVAILQFNWVECPTCLSHSHGWWFNCLPAESSAGLSTKQLYGLSSMVVSGQQDFVNGARLPIEQASQRTGQKLHDLLGPRFGSRAKPLLVKGDIIASKGPHLSMGELNKNGSSVLKLLQSSFFPKSVFSII